MARQSSVCRILPTVGEGRTRWNSRRNCRICRIVRPSAGGPVQLLIASIDQVPGSITLKLRKLAPSHTVKHDKRAESTRPRFLCMRTRCRRIRAIQGPFRRRAGCQSRVAAGRFGASGGGDSPRGSPWNGCRWAAETLNCVVNHALRDATSPQVSIPTQWRQSRRMPVHSGPFPSLRRRAAGSCRMAGGMAREQMIVGSRMRQLLRQGQRRR